MTSNWIDLSSTAVENEQTLNFVIGFVTRLQHLVASSKQAIDEGEVEGLRISAVRSLHGLHAQRRVAAEAYICLLADLAKQGWSIRLSGHTIEGSVPTIASSEVRERRRRQLAAKRNEQLRETATREFIYRMERGHVYKGAHVSIFSLMRDGRDLVAALSDNGAHVIRPYVQIVKRPAACEFTGFELTDIWRYFRHTWATPYESTPGRSMSILVRDAGAPSHPVIGIAALSSAASVHPVRDDKFIRWSGKALLRDAMCFKPCKKHRMMQWLQDFLNETLEELYDLDFVEERILPCTLPEAIPDTVRKLRHIAKIAKAQHFSASRNPVEVHRSTADTDWAEQARTPLYRAKRAAEFAELLSLRQVVALALSGRVPSEAFDELLTSPSGRTAIKKIVQRARARSIGSAIADLTVCGSVAPYNEIVGGKLVALLSVSPELISAYKERYSDTASVISSSMAGRRVVRSADLVFVGTTSLYGIRPNQYDRAVFPCSLLGGNGSGSFGFKYMGETEGVGTSQFGDATKRTLERLAKANGNSRRVNNIFGEGANPRLRLLRDGLDVLGLPKKLLEHGLKKAAYGVPLVDPETLRDYLLGITRTPRYIFGTNDVDHASRVIGEYWIGRWVEPRLLRPETRERIRSHVAERAAFHGARVTLPMADVEQRGLF